MTWTHRWDLGIFFTISSCSSFSQGFQLSLWKNIPGYRKKKPTQNIQAFERVMATGNTTFLLNSIFSPSHILQCSCSKVCVQIYNGNKLPKRGTPHKPVFFSWGLWEMSVEAPENKCLCGLAARQSQCRAARGAEGHVSALLWAGDLLPKSSPHTTENGRDNTPLTGRNVYFKKPF